jgi:hypothetical protein
MFQDFGIEYRFASVLRSMCSRDRALLPMMRSGLLNINGPYSPLRVLCYLAVTNFKYVHEVEIPFPAQVYLVLLLEPSASWYTLG